MYYLLLKGLILGFAIAAPVGPIGLLCINRTIQNGKLSGFLSGMGAATADMFYGAIAAFGLSALSGFLINQASWIKIIGGLFLVYLGLSIFLAKKSTSMANIQSKGIWSDYFSTLFLTVTNPMTILSFTAIFASMGIVGVNKGFLGSLALVSGVFFGSALWWLLLSFLVAFISKKFDDNFIGVINKLSGVIIMFFGFLSLLA